MGFKITPSLLPSRLLVWPLWHMSTWRLHGPPDSVSGTTDTTKWPQFLHFHFVLVIIFISRRIVFLTLSLVSRWNVCPHLFSGFKVFVCIQCYFSFLCLWMFTDFYQRLNVITLAPTKAINSWGVLCLSLWIDFANICNQQTDSPTWLVYKEMLLRYVKYRVTAVHVDVFFTFIEMFL